MSGKENDLSNFYVASCRSHRVGYERGGSAPLGDARIACRQWMSQRQRPSRQIAVQSPTRCSGSALEMHERGAMNDMVILAHIREQHR
jgi:hypothetical protein